MTETTHSEELVYTAAGDGVPLEGVVIRPSSGELHDVAVVWVHGLSSRFYSPTGVRIGRALAGHGYASSRATTEVTTPASSSAFRPRASHHWAAASGSC